MPEVIIRTQHDADTMIPELLRGPAPREVICDLTEPVSIERFLWLTGPSTCGPWTDCLGRRRGGGGIGGMTISGKPSGDITSVRGADATVAAECREAGVRCI
jgi:hypothetical protein